MFKKILVTYLLCVFSIFSTEASIAQSKCIPNHQAIDNNEPEVFNTTNNLLRITGQEGLFCGQKILLNLEVVDKNCVPISDAKVYLWQVGCDHKFPYKPLRTKVNHHLFNHKAGSTFTGSGIATTNNVGKSKFLTIYPSDEGKKSSSHINIRIEHAKLGTFQTQIILKDHILIEEDDYDTLNVRIVTPWNNILKKY
jgi:protocatechuate 3,4-dioxygenase, beta subunit